MAITDWPIDDRLAKSHREGAGMLSDAELVAISAHRRQGQERRRRRRVGAGRASAASACSAANVGAMTAVAGLGTAIRAIAGGAGNGPRACARSRARFALPSGRRARLPRLKLRTARTRSSWPYFDAQNRVLAVNICSGARSPRPAFIRGGGEALAHNAAALIFAHNHPWYRRAQPLRQKRSAKATEEAGPGRLVDVKVLDHIVVGSGAEKSFAERGPFFRRC
jgi:DNA repair protein RadC